MFLSKYIKKGEANYIRSYLHSKGAIQLLSIPNSRDIKVQYSSAGTLILGEESSPYRRAITKTLSHNNINMFILSKKMNRVKYNSWYKRIEQRNMLSSSQ
mmetsp:Transcript_32237/g.31546  ORF Transcript_32237/g.31546 Transcript_32237/m.31546 type:complete len:100 (+) Transcript_32237:362-661(+)